MDKKVRETTLPLISYLTSVKDGDISEDQDVQRRFCSDNSFVNGIAVTTTTGDYLPPIILGEIPYDNGTKQLYIVDANQRTAALMMIRFGNYKITSAVEDSEVTYQAKKVDENGDIVRDKNGSIVWEQKTYDIKNKTFDDFPYELQKEFDNFQVRVVTHTNCTINDVSKLVRRYNNHRSMNVSQKALTYLDAFARKVKTIVRTNDFFKDTIEYKDKENQKGTYERSLCECVMTVNYLNSWKKSAKPMNVFLNNNAKDENFDLVDEYATRMNAVCGNRFHDIFLLKDLPVWFKAFDLFSQHDMDDEEFAEFLEEFNKEIRFKQYDGVSFEDMEHNKYTKDKKVIMQKIEILNNAMSEYFHWEKVDESEENDIENNVVSVPDELKEYVEEYKKSDTIISLNIKDENRLNNLALKTLDFVTNNVNSERDFVDVELYMSILDDWTANIPGDSWILRERNIVPLVGIVAYVCEIEMDSEAVDWFIEFEKYKRVRRDDDIEKFNYMKKELSDFLEVHK